MRILSLLFGEWGINLVSKIKNNLGTKIFLSIAAILLVVCLLMFGILRIFLPHTYENELTAQLSKNLQSFANELEVTPIEEWKNKLLSFCLDNNVSSAIFNEDREQITAFSISVYAADNGAVTGQNIAPSLDTATLVFSFEQDGTTYVITASTNANAINQVAETFPKVFPYVLGIILIMSASAAFFYSCSLAKPIVEISNVSKRMAALDMTWRCDVKRTDEIGILAGNLNEMAIRLNNALGELQMANEKLQADIDKGREQDKRRRDFFSAISHELKTPITILKGELDGMILNVGKFKDRDKYLQEAYQTTETIEKLVREILTLAKLDTLSLDLQEMSLGSLVDGCCQIYSVLAADKHIEISTHYEGEIVAQVDKAQMRTVISNIIGNAVKHSPEGSMVDIRIAGKTLTVENSGVHIALDELLQVWEPFYRTDKSRSRDTGGSGLGLYIVKSILDLHGFDYVFENTDVGMKFTIIFP